MFTQKFSLAQTILVGLSTLVLSQSCQKNAAAGGGEGGLPENNDSEIIRTFTDEVTIATYQDLVAKSLVLNAAAKLLRDAPSEVNFQAARAAWIASRVPWEQSEAFLFGPVATFSLDPAIDSWPLDYSGIDAAVAQFAQKPSVDLDTEAVDVKGFHAIEFLLYGEANSKTLALQTKEERAYLAALTENHSLVTKRILSAWQEGTQSTPPFAFVFTSAGAENNTIYPSSKAAIEELLNNMVGIADEVGSTKIGQPFEQQDPNKVESQYSFNSLADFQNNIRSLRFVYQGNRSGKAAVHSLSNRIMTKDPGLNIRVEASIDAALAALQAIPEPFRRAITDPSAKPAISNALQTLLNLSLLLDSEVRKAL